MIEFETLLPADATVAAIGLGGFLACFMTVAVLEAVWPARRGAPGAPNRMAVNFGLGLANSALILLVPLSSLAAAGLAQDRGWGLFALVSPPWWAALAVLVVARSLTSYATHWLFHNVAWLWPLHAVHHRDDAIDLSTTFRSHPGNYLLSSAVNFALVLALGPAVLVAVIADLVLTAAGLFHHANLRLPDQSSARLERWLVTPRMHLVHHARARELHDSNYGDLLSVWDHLFGTYRAAPPEGFAIGVPPARVAAEESLSR